jgi:hypothetical protein
MLVIRAWPNFPMVLEPQIATAPRTSPNQAGAQCAKSAVKILKFYIRDPCSAKTDRHVMELLDAMVPIPPRADSAGLAVEHLTKGNVKMDPLGSDHLCARLSNSPSALGVAAK